MPTALVNIAEPRGGTTSPMSPSIGQSDAECHLPTTSVTRDRWRRRLIAFQAAYYLAMGLWPLVQLPSFEAVTGPKTDDWLVHMVGLLAGVIGAALGVAAVHDRHRAHPRSWCWRQGPLSPLRGSTCGTS